MTDTRPSIRESSMETCIVTGSSGLIGRELVAVLLERGYRVRAWQRSDLPGRREHLERASFALGTTSPADLERAMEGSDAIVHCAWDFEPVSWADIERVNVRGSIDLFEAAARAGVRKLIFLSSVSAYSGCASRYGRSKLAVEDAVQKLGGISVRSGMVHGDFGAGAFGRLWKSAAARWVPLVDGGRQKLLLIHRRDLAIAIETMLSHFDDWRGRTVVLAHPEPVTLRALVERAASEQGREAHFVSVPGRVLYSGLRMVEALGLRFSFRSDSLLTLLGPDPVVTREDLERLGVPLRSLDEALRARSSS